MLSVVNIGIAGCEVADNALAKLKARYRHSTSLCFQLIFKGEQPLATDVISSRHVTIYSLDGFYVIRPHRERLVVSLGKTLPVLLEVVISRDWLASAVRRILHDQTVRRIAIANIRITQI